MTCTGRVGDATGGEVRGVGRRAGGVGGVGRAGVPSAAPLPQTATSTCANASHRCGLRPAQSQEVPLGRGGEGWVGARCAHDGLTPRRCLRKRNTCCCTPLSICRHSCGLAAAACVAPPPAASPSWQAGCRGKGEARGMRAPAQRMQASSCAWRRKAEQAIRIQATCFVLL